MDTKQHSPNTGAPANNTLHVNTARLRQPEPYMRLAVRGVTEGALRTHYA